MSFCKTCRFAENWSELMINYAECQVEENRVEGRHPRIIAVTRQGEVPRNILVRENFGCPQHSPKPESA